MRIEMKSKRWANWRKRDMRYEQCVHLRCNHLPSPSSPSLSPPQPPHLSRSTCKRCRKKCWQRTTPNEKQCDEPNKRKGRRNCWRWESDLWERWAEIIPECKLLCSGLFLLLSPFILAMYVVQRCFSYTSIFFNALCISSFLFSPIFFRPPPWKEEAEELTHSHGAASAKAAAKAQRQLSSLQVCRNGVLCFDVFSV